MCIPIKSILRRILRLYLKQTDTVKWARFIGVNVGEHTTIASSVIFSSEPYLITIGNYVQVTREVTFHTHGGGHVLRDLIPDFDCFGRIVVEDNVYIGSNSIILPGITIGKGSLVAAGSVVTKSVRPRTVVGGNPAKELCTIEDYFEKNKCYNTSTKGLNYEQKKALLLSMPAEKFISK